MDAVSPSCDIISSGRLGGFNADSAVHDLVACVVGASEKDSTVPAQLEARRRNAKGDNKNFVMVVGFGFLTL